MADDHATYTRLSQQITERGPWQQTATGNAFFPADPRPEEVRLEDVARALSRICRYCGHLRSGVSHFSVAQHAVNVSRWMQEDGWNPRACYAGLHHDSAEAYTGDIVSPVKYIVPELRPFLRRVERVVDEAFGVVVTPGLEKSIKFYDFVALATEVRDVMAENVSTNSWGDLPPPRAEYLSGLVAADAYAAFVGRHRWLLQQIEKEE